MKTNTHPPYYQDAVVTCACGNKFSIASTKQEIHVEVCSACHPLYTGQQRLVDTAGRVDRFANRMAKTKTLRSKTEPKPTPTSKKSTTKKVKATAKRIR